MTTLPKPHVFSAADSKPLRWGIFGAGWISDVGYVVRQLIRRHQANRFPG